MRNRSLFQTCILSCVVAFCWPDLVLERVKADGEDEANKSASPAALHPSLPPPALHLPRRQQQTEDENEQQQQAQEQPPQRDVTLAFSPEQVPTSCGAGTSFVETRVNADSDVSCFPHNENIGCRSDSVRVVRVDSVQACLRECRKVDKCTHYTYNKLSRECHVKAAVPVFYTYNGDMTGPRSCDTSCFLGCLTYNVTPMRTFHIGNKTPAFCQAACRALNGCITFVFENGECKFLKSGFSAYRVVSGGNTVAGPKQYCENRSDLRGEELRDGHSIGSCLKSDNIGSRMENVESPFETPDVGACQQRCASNNRCTHYTYNTSSRRCFMKAGNPQYYVHKDDVTGSKDCVPT